MSTRTFVRMLVLSSSFLAACAKGGAGAPRRAVDAGTRSPAIDAGAPLDAGLAPVDAGPSTTPSADAGRGEPSEIDAGSLADAGSDAGAPSIDAGTDAGSDAGPPATPDAGSPPPRGCTALPATGVIALSGDTTSGPTWNRPLATTCPASSRSAIADAVPYATHVLCNEGGAGTFDLEVSGSIADSYLVVYRGEGLPADALACLEGDDDSGSSASQAAVTALAIGAGERITVVVTGFDNADYGAYSLAITRR